MRARLLLSLVPTVLCAIVVSVHTFIVSRQDDPELGAAMRMVEITSQQELAMIEMSEALRGYLLDPTHAEEFARKKAADARYIQLADELKKLTVDNPEIQKLNSQMAEFDATTLDERENRVGAMIQSRDPKAIVYYNQEYVAARRDQVENFLKMKALVRKHSDATIARLKERTYLSGLASIAALWVGMVIGLGLTALVAFQVTRRTEQLFTMIHKVSDTVAQSSHSIRSEANELSGAVQRQSAAIQETAASVDEISAMIKKNTDNAMDSRHHSKVCRDHAEGGVQSFQKLMESIEDVKRSQDSIFREVEKSHQGIAEINSIITQIDEKTRVINDIVFQTKLLSFNASVEAARAGEGGKGFAVVAEEVGNLARMSGVAAQEITGLLSQSTNRVSRIIQETNTNVRLTIEKAASLLDESVANVSGFQKILTEIKEDVKQVDSKVDAISVASREQESAVAEIATVMQGLDADTQKSALIAHHSAERARKLNDQADELEQLVVRMTLLLRGDKGKAEESPKSRSTPASQSQSPKEDDAFEDDQDYDRHAAA